MSLDRVMPNALPMSDINMFLALEWGKMRPLAHEAHSMVIDHIKPTPVVRFLGLGDNASAFAPHKEFKDTRRVRHANFQKWVKKFNVLGDLYDHLASLK